MMKNPPHPGGIIRRQIFFPLGLTVSDAAKVLRVSRPAISNLVNERVSLSADMAIRLEKAFGADMETMLALQHAYDVAAARARSASIRLSRYKTTHSKNGRRKRAA